MSETHYVADACIGELCQMCGRAATHKIEEVHQEGHPRTGAHPFTVYLCCGDFGKVMGAIAVQYCFGDVRADAARRDLPKATNLQRAAIELSQVATEAINVLRMAKQRIEVLEQEGSNNAALRDRAEDADRLEAMVDRMAETIADLRFDNAIRDERLTEMEHELESAERQRDQYRAALEAAGVEI